jgi:hypothetical protein
VLDPAQEYGSQARCTVLALCCHAHRLTRLRWQDFFGAIDEVRIWRVARSAADIRGTMETYSSAALAKHPDLIAYWTFDEGEGRMVRDVSGHGNDLVLTHEPKWCAAPPESLPWHAREAAHTKCHALARTQGGIHHR